MGVVCSTDGLTPIQVNGSQAGILVTNISTEIAGIATAVQMILKTTDHLPTNFNAPNARAQWFADRISKIPPLPGQESPPPSYTILSDCQYAIHTCSAYAPSTDVYWIEARRVQRALHTLRARGVRVTLDWIPGHCGHPLGDLADATAKHHSTNTSLPSYPPFAAPTPFQVAKNFAKARAHAWILSTWWTNYQSLRPQHLYNFQPHSRTPPPILIHVRSAKNRTRVSILRLLLGQANNNNHMFHCGMRSSSACSHCPLQKDSSNHRILSCPAYIDQRTVYTATLRAMGLTLSIPTAIGLKQVPTHHHPAAASALVLFLENTNLTQLFVWDATTQDTLPTPALPPLTSTALSLAPAPPHHPSNPPAKPPSQTITQSAQPPLNQTLMTQYIPSPLSAQNQ